MATCASSNSSSAGHDCESARLCSLVAMYAVCELRGALNADTDWVWPRHWATASSGDDPTYESVGGQD